MNITYKFTFLALYFLSLSILLGVVYYFNNISEKSNINTLSKKSHKEFFKEKQSYIRSYINNYKNSLNSIANNEIFVNYLNNKESKNTTQQLFLLLAQTIPNVFQIRYINNSGQEIIKIEKNNTIKIVEDKLLQDKSNSEYFKIFKNNSNFETLVSSIDLNKEYGKVSIPKKATLRIAKRLNNNGFLVLNIDLIDFFGELKHNQFYNLFLLDEKGRFILHEDKNYGIYSDKYETYFLKNKFGDLYAKKILELNEFDYYSYYSKKINLIENSNIPIYLLIESKYKVLKENTKNEKMKLFYLILFIAVITLPLAIYYASIPEKLRKKALKQFITDELTNLPNQEALFKDFKEKKFNNHLLILIHISNQRSIQNIYGYSFSKSLIIECANTLRKYLAYNKDFKRIYKIKDNVFALKYKIKDSQNLLNTIKKLQHYLEKHEFNIQQKDLISIDTVISTSSIENKNSNITKLKEAEIAMDKAFEENLNISIYNESHVENIQRNKANLEKIQIIKEAIENDGIQLAYQAIYSNKRNCVEKYEVLIRLNHKGRIIYPDDFLRISKKIKKYKFLTKIIIEKAFNFFENKDVEFSLNLSMEDILDDEIKSFLFHQIKKYDVKDRFVVELVETEAINNYEVFTQFIKDIKKHECKIAIDDFGSGYSNYDYIIKLSEYIDYLKIDGSLITDIDTNRKTQLLVGTLKFLCDNLQIQTIAEYVENEKIFDYVKSMDISFSQGYYIGKPNFELSSNDIKVKKDELPDF